MNLLDALKADDTPAGKAALADYLMENDVPETIDDRKIACTIRDLLNRACRSRPVEEIRLKFGQMVEVRIACTEKRGSVTIYANGKRVLRVSQENKTFNGDSLNKAVWAVKSLRCETAKRILSGIDV